MVRCASWPLVVLLFVCCLGFEFNPSAEVEWEEPYNCYNKCALPITWATPALGVCGQDLQNYYNALCNTTLSSFAQCLLKNIGKPNPNVGVSYPGDCGCPNYCYNATQQGTCNFGQCECAQGWIGEDCSRVSSTNPCNGQGTVQDVSGVQTCVCNPGYVLMDCSAQAGPLPPITQTINPIAQYSSWDEYGDQNPIFNDSTIAQIHLTMDPSVLEFMLDPVNKHTETYYPVKMWFQTGDTLEQMDQVGFRLKGGASRGYVKKTWKLNFDKYVDRKWAQQKKIELKSLQQDPSAIKEKLCLSLLYSINAPAQRSSYGQLFINGQAMGAYLIEESVDDQFLKSRFGNEDGAFFKCQADLAYLGADPQLYNISTYSPESFLAETTLGLELIRDLTYIISEHTSDEEFVAALPHALDVDLYVRTLAFEVLTGNWDGLWNGNNYYLYWNPDVQVFQYFRHDMDMSFGMWDTFYNRSNVNVYDWGTGGRGYRLINRVLATQPFRQQFTDYCYQLIDAYFHLEGDFIARMDYLNNELRPLILRDQWRTTDFAWSYPEYERFPDQGYTRKTSGSMPENGFPFVHSFGLKEFMTIRIQTALQQLDPPSFTRSSSF